MLRQKRNYRYTLRVLVSQRLNMNQCDIHVPIYDKTYIGSTRQMAISQYIGKNRTKITFAIVYLFTYLHVFCYKCGYHVITVYTRKV